MKKSGGLNADRKKIAVVISVVAVIAIAIGAYFADDFIGKKDTDGQNGKSQTDEKYCDISIDLPTLDNEAVSKEIKDYVESKKSEFEQTAKTLPKPEDGVNYNFTAKYETGAVGDTESVHVIISSYTGSGTARFDKSYIYNKKSGAQIKLGDMMESENSLNVFSSLSYRYLNEYSQKNSLSIADENIKGATAANENNFANVLLKEDGIEEIFMPEQLGIEKEAAVTIPYTDLIGTLKKEYLNGAEKSTVKRDLSKFKDKKLICFTFDDGPGGKYTNKLMDNLDKYDARVTFFVVGSRVNSYKSTLKRAYDQGNEIGSHTYSHSNLTKLNDAELKKEINDTNNLIENVTGAKPTLIRPPYGSTNDRVKKTSGMYNILWSIDTLDWKHRDKNKVADAITKNAFDGAIVLMHDIYETSVDGALIAMDKLSKEGYAFVTVDEMRELRGAEWDISKNYTSFKK